MIRKHRQLGIQFGRYFGVALIGFVIDFGSLIFLREVLGLHYLVAASVGFTAGLLVTYFLSNKFVFSNPKINSKSAEFLLFSLIGIIGLGILNLLMWILTDGIGINYAASKLLATIFVYCWNFFARRSLYNDADQV